MNKLSEMSAVAHLQSLTQMLTDLGRDGVELFGHRYSSREFGGFEIVLGREMEQFKLTWDSFESILSVSFVPCPSKSASALWAHEANISIPEGRGLFQEIAAMTRYLLAREQPRGSPQAGPQRPVTSAEAVFAAQTKFA